MSRRSGARHPTAKLKGGWSPEEDALLTRLVKKFGEGNWSPIARALNEATGKTETTGRIGKQCRERWNHHLSPGLRKDPWTPEEEVLVVDAHKRLGNRWSDIARCISGRSENAVKNHWNATLRKRVTPDNPAGPLKEYLDTLNLSVTPRRRGSGGGGVKRKRGAARDSDCTSDEAEPDPEEPTCDPHPGAGSRATSPSQACTAAAITPAPTPAATPTKSRRAAVVTAATATTAALATGPITTARTSAAIDGPLASPAGGIPTASGAGAGAGAGAALVRPRAAAGARSGTRPFGVDGAAAALIGGEVDGAVRPSGGVAAAAAAVAEIHDKAGGSTAGGGPSARRRSRRLAAQVGTERLRSLVEAERREREEEEDEMAELHGGDGCAMGGDSDDSETLDDSAELAAPEATVGATQKSSHEGGGGGKAKQLARPSAGDPLSCLRVPSRADSICNSALPTQIGSPGAPAARAPGGNGLPVAARPVGSSPLSRAADRPPMATASLPYVGLVAEAEGSTALPLLPPLPPLRPVLAPSPLPAGAGAGAGAAGSERELASPMHGTAGGAGDTCGEGGGWGFPYNWSTNNMQTLAAGNGQVSPPVSFGWQRGGGGKVRPQAASGAGHVEGEAVAAAEEAAAAAAGAVPSSAPTPAPVTPNSGAAAAAAWNTHRVGPGCAAVLPTPAVAAASGGAGVGAGAGALLGEPCSGCPAPPRSAAEEDDTSVFLFLAPAQDVSASMCHMRQVASGSALLSYDTEASEERRHHPSHQHHGLPQQQYPQTAPTAPSDNSVWGPVVDDGARAGSGGGGGGAPAVAANAPISAADAGKSGGGDGGGCPIEAPCPLLWLSRQAMAGHPVRTWTPPNLFDEPHLEFGCPDSPLLAAVAATATTVDGAGDALSAGYDSARLVEGPAAFRGAAAPTPASAGVGVACDSSISSVGSPLSHVREYGDSGAFDAAGAQKELAGLVWGSRPETGGGGGAAAAVAAVGAAAGAAGEVVVSLGYVSTAASPVAACAVVKRESSFSGCSFVPPSTLGPAPLQQQQQQALQAYHQHHQEQQPVKAVCHPSSPEGSSGGPVRPPAGPASPGSLAVCMPPPSSAGAATAPPVQMPCVIGHPVLPPPYIWHPGAPVPHVAAGQQPGQPPVHSHPHYGLYGGQLLMPPGGPQPPTLHPAVVPPYAFLSGPPPSSSQPGPGHQQMPQPQPPSLCQESSVSLPPPVQPRPVQDHQHPEQQQQQQQAPKAMDYPEFGTSTYVVSPSPYYYSWAPYTSYGSLYGCMPYHAAPTQVTGVPVQQQPLPAAPLEYPQRLVVQAAPAPAPAPQRFTTIQQHQMQPGPAELQQQQLQHQHQPQQQQLVHAVAVSADSFAGEGAAMPGATDIPRLSCTSAPQVVY